ncbi:MAG: alpha-hydroxy-acid oxidizing protein [Acidobacteria bacterium]|nr:alpha-hydroxy-acid oxidizing protein [Acidobacteriota bacterium]
MTNDNYSRRSALRNLAALFAASPLAKAQLDLPYTAAHVPSLDELVNVFEFEPICRARIPKQNYDFIAGGVDAEWSLRHNREAFDKIALRPRMMVDTSGLDVSTTVFGDKLEMPILIAPTAGHGLANPEGEVATAKAAAHVKTILILSTNSTQPYEKVAQASTFPKWFQLYPGPDLEGTRERVERAVGAGFKLICLTVDAGWNSHRERLLRNRLRTQTPPGVNSPQSARRRQREGEEPQKPPPYRLSTTLMHRLDWRFFADLKKYAKVPVIIKGIMTGEDAALAVKHGADGVVVSNHGGRYLDYAAATIEMLPEVVKAVNGRIPVLVDSGFRRGTDILKALAIGAKAVCVGRPPLWGLGAYGEQGVVRVLELLQSELALAMGLSGRSNLASIDHSLLKYQ